jgi:cytochrome b subunit of formate dehydrogenase
MATASRAIGQQAADRTYERFTLSERIEHAGVVLAFVILAVTGLPQKFIEAGWAQTLIQLMGGIELTRQIHHIAAIVLLLESVYHLAAVGYRIIVRGRRLSMLPTLQDALDAFNTFLFNLGLRRQRPQGGRFTFEEKAEYWALVWGTAVMAITGLMMWNPIATARWLPGQVIPAAKAAHGGEAILAVLAIILWHMWGVHLRHFNRSMFTGKLSEHEMIAEHPLELADIKAGVAERPAAPGVSARRRQLYLPIALVASAVLVAGIVWFVTFEETALATVEHREQVQVFLPLTPTPLPTARPTATPIPLLPVWDGNIALVLEQKCIDCHGAGGIAGLDVSTYNTLMAGSKSGPVVVPGDPEGSLIVTKQEKKHPGKLSEFELQVLKDWIAAGAPER